MKSEHIPAVSTDALVIIEQWDDFALIEGAEWDYVPTELCESRFWYEPIDDES